MLDGLIGLCDAPRHITGPEQIDPTLARDGRLMLQRKAVLAAQLVPVNSDTAEHMMRNYMNLKQMEHEARMHAAGAAVQQADLEDVLLQLGQQPPPPPQDLKEPGTSTKGRSAKQAPEQADRPELRERMAV
jgi:hypothetical protein